MMRGVAVGSEGVGVRSENLRRAAFDLTPHSLLLTPYGYPI